MVSLWPWKGTDSSPESFEKTLSSLSSKITTSQTRLDRLHTSARRTKVLWTLYLSFAYLVYAIVLLLVVGHKNLGAYEWTGMAGGPMLIYVARAVISAYFNFRIDSQATRLKGYQDERANTIQKLKDATKYDSTMELIEKYGGERKKRDEKDAQEDNKQDRDKEAKRPAPPSGTGRTHFPPPPTANIVRPDARQLPPPAPQVQQHEADAELVNGQAPPGTKSLAEVGMWRCMGCGKTNGEVDEGKRIVEEVLGSKEAQAREEDGAEAEPQVANDAGAEENEGGNRAGAERSR
ncbi:hypothetical protein J3458_012325 [Metarhizium acridum]|uniref:uncharacterized protein n=1 Tax=Metarhizium acridum TaxID=92637 RepID=UPI001C6C1AA8|nr:hypothetical protein J3458_012325 [Metarhizium acridum]